MVLENLLGEIELGKIEDRGGDYYFGKNLQRKESPSYLTHIRKIHPNIYYLSSVVGYGNLPNSWSLKLVSKLLQVRPRLCSLPKERYCFLCDLLLTFFHFWHVSLLVWLYDFNTLYMRSQMTSCLSRDKVFVVLNLMLCFFVIWDCHSDESKSLESTDTLKSVMMLSFHCFYPSDFLSPFSYYCCEWIC